jgi:cellobiose epimerase
VGVDNRTFAGIKGVGWNWTVTTIVLTGICGESMNIDWQDFGRRVKAELLDDILQFWMNYAVDDANGGFYGALTNDRQVRNDGPRSAILCARILWTYAAAYRLFKDEAYRRMADRAYRYLAEVFWDSKHGGVYWSVDLAGKPLYDRKHSYAQGFSIYGLAEYYRATGDAQCLMMAQELFRLLEAHCYDSVNTGYVEGCSREWGPLADMRLSDKEPNCRKSMNTLLHIMEAYTNLRRVWADPRLEAQLRGLIRAFLEQVIDPRTHHFRLFFDDQWRSLSPNVSFGHDIEGSWLLVEAAEALGDDALLAQCRSEAVKMAEAVYHEARDEDGSVLHEATPRGIESYDRHWWVQAEGVVGFYNAYQLSGQAHFAEAAYRCWEYIESRVVDRQYGEWFKIVQRDGTPRLTEPKAGPWECPYHNSRMCYEVLARLAQSR